MRVIFSNNPRKLKAITKDLKGSIVYLQLSDSAEPSEIASFFDSTQNCVRLDKAELMQKHKGYFKALYIEFIAQLNRRQHPFDWSALNFTSKSRLSFNFYYRLFYVWIIDSLFRDKQADNLLIISDDYRLLWQIEILANKYGYAFTTRLSDKWRKLLLGLNRLFPVILAIIFLRTLIYSLIAKLLILQPRPKDKNHYIVKTLLSSHSFDKNNKFKDTYFNKLIEYLKEKKVPFVVNANILKPYVRNIFKIMRCQDDVIILPREICLRYFDITRCFIISLKRFYSAFGIKSKMKLDEVDVSFLVKSEIKQECGLKHYFFNLLEYYSMKSFSHNVKFDKIIYPFEHRSWESMFILALRERETPIRIVGYQHTSIAPKHTNFLLGEDEARYISLPDKIICMGRITRNIMQRYGNFPSGILEIGAALRQNISGLEKYPDKKRQISNILVALTTDTDEYMRMLTFLRQAFSSESSFRVRVRPHPMTFIEGASNKKHRLPRNFSFDRDAALDVSLSWTDIVFYSSSTVSLEALQRGIPVIYVDFGESLCPDPLFELNDFKWKVSKPEDIIRTIERIQDMPQETFDYAKKKARSYASEYIYPSVKDRLEVFI